MIYVSYADNFSTYHGYTVTGNTSSGFGWFGGTPFGSGWTIPSNGDDPWLPPTIPLESV